MLARLRKAQENNEGGFTLIELLVVMIIIGILAAIAIPAFLNQKKKAQESAAKSDASNIAKEISAALVDGPIWAVSLTATTGGYTLGWTNAQGTDSTLVKVSPGQVPTLSNTAAATPGAETFCVSVNPDLDGAATWTASHKGLQKTSCNV